MTLTTVLCKPRACMSCIRTVPRDVHRAVVLVDEIWNEQAVVIMKMVVLRVNRSTCCRYGVLTMPLISCVLTSGARLRAALSARGGRLRGQTALW